MTNPQDPEYSCLPWDGGPPRLLIETMADTHLWIDTCSHAQTLEAYSTVFKCTVWIPLPCKQWSCRYCAQKKINLLAHKTGKAKPNRLLTLTVDPAKWDSPRDAFDGTRRKVPELSRKIRARYGEFEYLRVTELCKSGWPHYHLLVRSQYIPQPYVKTLWQQLTGAIIVDLRHVKNKFDTFYYLVKYLSKLHNLKWTERHVSYSRQFFPQEDETERFDLGLTETKVLETHPAQLAYHQFRHSELVELVRNVYTLNPP
ncbi:MAG: hypothetical protein GTO14_23200, partial [Anaerolineales bacterium]|nr:hypothetical protein [Anaerolineae bacterium]NIS83039.1 hypothetical protein [Anaerolineales bacterium]